MAKAKKMETVSCDSDDKWKIESDFRTLKEAQMIKDDPERLEKALKFGKKEIKAIRNLDDVRAYKAKKDEEGYDGDSDDDND